MFISILLIIIGFAFLLQNLGIITGSVWGIIWPLALIALGVYFLLKRHRWGKFQDRMWKKFEE